MRLKDKTVLITGATSGIGFAAAQRAIEAVSYTHLDVYKRQRLCQSFLA